MRLFEQALVAVGFCFLAACGKHEQEANSPTVDPEKVTPSPAAQGRSAANSIADSRCKREARCENVGDGKKFSSDTDCVDRIRAEWKEDLNARECPKGVHDAQLDECLHAIVQEDCGSPLDSLQRIGECTTAQICAD